jgi:hypothetical protein
MYRNTYEICIYYVTRRQTPARSRGSAPKLQANPTSDAVVLCSFQANSADKPAAPVISAATANGITLFISSSISVCTSHDAL